MGLCAPQVRVTGFGLGLKDPFVSEFIHVVELVFIHVSVFADARF